MVALHVACSQAGARDPGVSAQRTKLVRLRRGLGVIGAGVLRVWAIRSPASTGTCV